MFFWEEGSLGTGTQGKDSVPLEAESGVMGLQAKEYLLTQLQWYGVNLNWLVPSKQIQLLDTPFNL